MKLLSAGSVLFILAFLLISLLGLSANQDYADQTKKTCFSCHLDPNGGPRLAAYSSRGFPQFHPMPFDSDQCL